MPTAYLFATGLGAMIWTIFFFIAPSLRRVQLTMSLAGAPLAVSDLFYVPQYWRPQTVGHIPIGIEGILFSFEAAGICAVIYPALRRQVSVPFQQPHPNDALSHSWIKAVPLLVP